MRGPRPFRLFLIVILALTPLVQSFWFGRAWRVIDAVAWPGPRTLLQGLWIVAAALDMLRVRVLPRRAFGMTPWGTTHLSSPVPWRPRCSSASPLANARGS